jgi:predicted nucleic acid-binding protein
VIETIVDSGPLVAFLRERDTHHAWATEVLGAMTRPLKTCEAVLTEACHLTRGSPNGPDAVLQLVERGVMEVESLATETTAIRALMRKYRDLPMSYADACLVRLSELHKGSQVFTVDSDFEVYRRLGRGRIRLIAPER